MYIVGSSNDIDRFCLFLEAAKTNETITQLFLIKKIKEYNLFACWRTQKKACLVNILDAFLLNCILKHEGILISKYDFYDALFVTCTNEIAGILGLTETEVQGLLNDSVWKRNVSDGAEIFFAQKIAGINHSRYFSLLHLKPI